MKPNEQQAQEIGTVPVDCKSNSMALVNDRADKNVVATMPSKFQDLMMYVGDRAISLIRRWGCRDEECDSSSESGASSRPESHQDYGSKAIDFLHE